MKIEGINRFQKRLERVADSLKREAGSIVKQEARALSVEFGSATLPGPGFAEPTKFRKRVEGEVRQVFASRSHPGQVYQMLSVHAPHLAGAYWRAVQQRKPRSAEAIVKKAGLPEGLNPSDHKKARAGHKGARVLRGSKPATLARESEVRGYAKEQVGNVGFAKAGWYAAAKAIGGRVRRSITGENGKRTSIEIFPGWVRKLANKNSGIGGAVVRDSGSGPSVTIFNSVKHAAPALKPSLKAEAISRANDNLKAALKRALAEVVRRR